MFKRTFLTGVALALLAAQACGSEDGKRKEPGSDGGMGGEAGSPERGGSSAGMPPVSPAAGAPSGGEPPVVEAGGSPGSSGGAPPIVVEAAAGAGGEPSPPVLVPDFELLFSVKPGAVGQADTGVDQAGTKENFIYASKTGKQELVNGTNTVKISGESLGLDPTDQIVAFALLQAEPTNPVYLFSVNHDSEGADTTRVYTRHWSGQPGGEGDIYSSDGQQSYLDGGEGSIPYGFNGMLATNVSLGLAVGDGEGDDLTGMAVHDASVPIAELYFTVAASAKGATDSSVSTVDVTERSCTVFKSALDGTNTVAFSCADLALRPSAADPDQIDALAVYGVDEPDSVVFSTTNTTQGAAGSAVEATRLAGGGHLGAVLFQSTGDGSNTVLKTPPDLGLGESGAGLDEIDGIAVLDLPVANVATAGSCTITDNQLIGFDGASHIGSDVLVLFGQDAVGPSLVAYDAATCTLLQRVSFAVGFGARQTAIVRLAGWKEATPLEDVEFLRVNVDDPGTGLALRRYDAAGTFVQAFPIAGTTYYDATMGLVHDPVHDQLYLLLHQYSASPPDTVRVFPRPAASVTVLDQPAKPRLHPCSRQANITGTDESGNLYVATLPDPSTGARPDYRVCTFTPQGELWPSPYWWSTPALDTTEGFIASSGSHFLLHGGATFTIERGAFPTP